jgi:hypothetical protein
MELTSEKRTRSMIGGDGPQKPSGDVPHEGHWRKLGESSETNW